MFRIGMCCVPYLILEHLITSFVSVAQLVSPSVALPAQLIMLYCALLSYIELFCYFVLFCVLLSYFVLCFCYLILFCVLLSYIVLTVQLSILPNQAKDTAKTGNGHLQS